MRNEYLKHGFSEESVKVIALPVAGSGVEGGLGGLNGHRKPSAISTDAPRIDAAYRLLFVGRMEVLKGGHVLLDALPSVLAAVNRPVQMTFVGDGRERASWEEKAGIIQTREPRLQVRFAGWLEGAALKRVFDKSDLLVVPSLWPEPFGLVGPEAGLNGLPAVAFDVGGISDWLTDGINGYLASGAPPHPSGLAEAIVKCLTGPDNYQRLRQGAVGAARRFSLGGHVKKLVELFQEVVRN